MANFSGLQSKFMRMYESNPQYRMLSVDSAMAQMVQDGVLTKAEYGQLIKTSAFGFGFNADLGDSVDFGGTTPVENYQHSPSGGIVTSKDKPKFGQLNNVYIETATLPANYQIIPGEYTILTGDSYTAFFYLSDIFNKAETSFEQQRMNEGWVSDAINAWREWINAKATRSDVSGKLADTRNDVELLNAAMRGALVDGNGNNVDFETAFEATRGVKYSKEKIELCQQKAETYAQADMFHTGLEDLISNLEKFSHGSSDLQYAKEFNKNALKTLSILGLSEQGKINEALAETSKAVGYEIKLVKQGTKGKDYYGQDFAIMFKNKDGKFVPLTPEISRMISDDLISKIDATKKTLLGLPLDSSDKEVEKHLERLKNEYEQSFREAYGDKDISTLSEEYITAQQKGLMAVNLGTNIVLIATSMLTGGVTAGLMTGLLMTQPLQALEMFTDENAETNLEAYGKMMLSQLPWMGAGMVMGKLGDLARSFVKLKGLQSIATKTGQSLDDLVKFMSKGGELEDDVIKVLKRTRIKADASGMTVEMLLDYAVTKLVQPEGATRQDWIMSFVGALAGSSLNKNISDFTKTKDVRAVELQKAFPDLRLSAEEAGKIISKIDEMVADGSWQQAVAKGADESDVAKASDTSSSAKTAKSIDELKNELKNSLGAVILDKYGVKLYPEAIERIIANIFRNTDDVNVIQQRYNVLTTKRNYVIMRLIDSELSNSDFILDNIDKVSSVFTSENIILIGPNSKDLLASLSKESLDLLASCTNKNDFVNCVKNIIYDASSHNIELGNRKVTVNLSDVIAIISGRMSLSYFETGSSAKFEQTVRNLTEIENFKEGEQYYYKISEGILLQRPDLIKIVDELNEALANSFERADIVTARFFEEKMNSGELPETITLQTVKPDENALILPENTFYVFKKRYLATTKVVDKGVELPQETFNRAELNYGRYRITEPITNAHLEADIKPTKVAQDLVKPKPYDENIPLKEQFPEFYQKLQSVSIETEKAGIWSLETQKIKTYDFNKLLKSYAYNPKLTEYLLFDIGLSSENVAKIGLLLENGHEEACIKMQESGLFELIKEGKLDEGILKNISMHSYLSDAVLSDIVKMRDGKSSVTTLPAGTNKADISRFVASGEVAEIDGKLYANNNGKPVEIKLTKEKFEELFPLVSRFGAKQGKTGDCWLVTTLSSLMDSPEGRINLYQLFSQDGDDILVKFPKSKQVVRFKNGQPANVNGKSVSGNNGFMLIEQAYVIERHNKLKIGQREADAKILEENLNWFNSTIEGGFQEYAMHKITGRNTWKGFGREIVSEFSWKALTNHENYFREKRIKVFEEFAKDKSKILYVATDLSEYSVVETCIDYFYDLYTHHAYSVKDYNPETGIVKISNPWHCEVVTEIPLEVLLEKTQYFGFHNADGTAARY